MSKQTDNDQALTQYLLGALSEAEAERFDELSVTDDEFADNLTVAEKDLVDAYVQGELAGAPLEQFKSHYLSSPLRREKVEFAQALQVWAEKAAAMQTAEVQAETSPQAQTRRKPSGTFFARSVFRVPRLGLRWGAAVAALVLLVAGGWLLFENIRLHQQLSQTQARRDVPSQREQELQKELEGLRSNNAQTAEELARVRAERERLEAELKQEEQQRLAEQQRIGKQPQSSSSGVSIASFVLAPQLRGGGQIREVSIPARTDYVAVRLELEPNDYAAYRVALINSTNNQTLWRSGRLKARTTGESKTLSLSFPAGLLKPQTYRLEVTGVSPSGAPEILSDYPFKVVNQ